MAIKYWEYEDAPLKEKLKDPSAREVAKIYFDNDTRAYRFAKALLAVKKSGSLRLKDCDNSLPIATWKRYLDFGVQVGLLKHEGNAYSFTDRYSKPFKNVATYIKEWIEASKEEDPDLLFADAKITRQQKRGGRQASKPEEKQQQDQAEGQGQQESSAQ
ncbi:MAG: hypothetical protein QXT43_02605 [Candidatus Micrarchaeaceae archaeon]